jgi:hypothetical protein
VQKKAKLQIKRSLDLLIRKIGCERASSKTPCEKFPGERFMILFDHGGTASRPHPTTTSFSALTKI